MYGCIVGKDEDGIWLLAEGEYEHLVPNVRLFESLSNKMDIRIFEIDEVILEMIRDNAIEITNKFERMF